MINSKISVYYISIILPDRCYAIEWLSPSSRGQAQSTMRWDQYDVAEKEIPCVFFASTIEDNEFLIMATSLNTKFDLPL